MRLLLSRDACAFYLVLAVEECCDIAEHLVAEQEWGTPENAGDAFALLARNGVIAQELSQQLREAVRQRNLIIHEYANVDWTRVHQAARDLDRLRRSATAVAHHQGLSS